MKKLLKDYALPGFLLLIKIVTTFRTGIDTFMMSGAMESNVTMLSFVSSILYIALIDAVLFGLWLFLAYGGEGRQAQLLRLFAAIGAWILYSGMIWIGWAAHPDAPGLALLGRVAGGLALAYDTYGLLAGPIRGWFIGIFQWIKKRMTPITPEEAYDRAINRALVQRINRSSGLIGKIVEDQMSTRIALELPDILAARLPLPAELLESSDDTSPVPLVVSSPLRSTAALKEAWNTCKSNFTPGQEFSRADIETCTSLGKSRANDILGYAVSVREASRVRHGVYLYNPVEVSGSSASEVIIQDGDF